MFAGPSYGGRFLGCLVLFNMRSDNYTDSFECVKITIIIITVVVVVVAPDLTNVFFALGATCNTVRLGSTAVKNNRALIRRFSTASR